MITINNNDCQGAAVLLLFMFWDYITIKIVVAGASTFTGYPAWGNFLLFIFSGIVDFSSVNNSP
jgi:hypothetical protein